MALCAKITKRGFCVMTQPSVSRAGNRAVGRLLRAEPSVPDQPIADDIAADAEESGGPELIPIAILVRGMKNRVINQLIQLRPFLLEQLLQGIGEGNQ